MSACATDLHTDESWERTQPKLCVLQSLWKRKANHKVQIAAGGREEHDEGIQPSDGPSKVDGGCDTAARGHHTISRKGMRYILMLIKAKLANLKGEPHYV